MIQTFTDRYDDDLEVQVFDAVVEFEAYNGHSLVTLEFDRDTADEIASFISREPEVAEAKAPVDPVTLFSGESGNERYEWNRVAALAAMKLGLSLEFKYTKSESSPVESRKLAKVTDVVQSSEGHYLIIGHSDERDDARSFRVDRMVSYAHTTGP